MGVDEGKVVATEAVDFDVVRRDDDDDEENACGNQSFCQLLLSNNGEVVELEHSFRFSPPLFQHSLSASSSSYSSSCCSTSSSSGLLCFGATAEGEEALLFRGRTDDDSGTRKATPTSAPSKRKRDDRAQKKPNPSNKGRKQKLGERVAALQQLVSPFGKTDTASVLHEAMGYIKFLQEQVQVLCTPYLQHHPPHPQPQPQPRPPDDEDPGEAEEGAREGGGGDLRSRGLCLVPVACCVHMQGSCVGADFWSPSTRR